MTGDIIWGLMIPFIGTTAGSGMVYLMRGQMRPAVQKILTGFAAGVMMAASVWSLLLPAIDKSEQLGLIGWLPPAVGFLLGMGFLLLLDTFTPHQHLGADEPEGLKTSAKKSTMLMLAVTLHNIPEGIAVGVLYAALAVGDASISLSSALALSLGIAIQNFPEGAIISMPLRAAGHNKHKAFMMGTFSGVVEPIAAGITVLMAHLLVPVLPYLLAFAAGAMIYVVVEELIPELQVGSHSNIGTIGVALGFTIMMILDVALG